MLSYLSHESIKDQGTMLNGRVDSSITQVTPPSPDTITTICFSRLASVGARLLSRPKGVILSHENLVAATSAAITQLDMYAPRRTDILYSYLPLAHTLERCCELAVFMAGGAVGFSSGSIKFAESDLKALRPTILPAVPKFLNRIYDSCVAAANKVSLDHPICNRQFLSHITLISDELVPTHFQLWLVEENRRTVQRNCSEELYLGPADILAGAQQGGRQRAARHHRLRAAQGERADLPAVIMMIMMIL